MATKHEELERLVRELQAAKKEFDRLSEDEEGEHKLGPPATPQQIAKLEAMVGKPLPASYRAFLELHNGWSDFDGGAKILSVEDQTAAWVKKRVKEMGDAYFEDEDEGNNPFEKGMIPVMLGKDEDNYLVLDTTKVRKNGEMDFVMYDYAEEEERFKDFTAFLKDDLETTKELIKAEKEGAGDDEKEDEGDEDEE